MSVKLFQCQYNYETPEEKGIGRLALIATSEDDAIIKTKMIAGADSRCTDCIATEVRSGFLRLGHHVIEDEKQIQARENAERARSVAPRYLFEVAAKAEVVASDKWDAYRKFGGMVKQSTPPPGLKRKVVSQELLDNITRREANEQYSVTRIFQGGKAGS